MTTLKFIEQTAHEKLGNSTIEEWKVKVITVGCLERLAGIEVEVLDAKEYRWRSVEVDGLPPASKEMEDRSDLYLCKCAKTSKWYFVAWYDFTLNVWEDTTSESGTTQQVAYYQKINFL